MRVLAAMSGGVDSAVAAALAVEAGHDVTGVHLALVRRTRSRSAPAPAAAAPVEDARDARRAADVLGIPFYVWDLSDRFARRRRRRLRRRVRRRADPNPCLRCNERIKFSAVLDRAVALGFDAVCHRALRPARDRPDGVLSCTARSTPPRTSRTCSAVLDADAAATRRSSRSATRQKSEVRAEAAARGLAGGGQAGLATTSASSPTATPRGSSTTGSAPERATSSTPTASRSGSTPARTTSLSVSAAGCGWAYQPPMASRASFSTSHPVSNTVTVGPRESLAVRRIEGVRPRWTQAPRRTAWRGLAQLRAHGLPVVAHATASDDRVEMILNRRSLESLRARPQCSTTAAGWSAAPPSPPPTREQSAMTGDAAAGPLHWHRFLARHRHGVCDQDRVRRSALTCRTCRNYPHVARTPSWLVARLRCWPASSSISSRQAGGSPMAPAVITGWRSRRCAPTSTCSRNWPRATRDP